MLFESYAFHQHVIHIGLHILPNLVLKNFIDHQLVCIPCIFQAKRYGTITKGSFVMKEVFSSFFRCIGIWWYPKLASKEFKNLNLAMESTNLSIFERGKLSLGKALFKSVKSTNIFYFHVLFFTITTLAIQFGYMTSQMKPTTHNLSTFMVIAYCLSPLKFIFLCWTSGWLGLTYSLWVAVFGMIPNKSNI